MRSLCLALALLLLPAHGSAEATVQVGIYDFKPLVYQDEDGQARGIYVDLLNAVSREENWNVEYVHCNWPKCLELLERGQIDLMTGILSSPERQEKFDFSRVSVLSTWGQLYSRPGAGIEGFRDLEGKSIAVVERGYFYPRLRQYLERFDVDARFVRVATYRDVFRLTARGEVDACSAERVTGMLAERNRDIAKTPLMYHPKEFLFAAPEDEEGLLRSIDENLRKFKRGGEGSLYEQTLRSISIPAVESAPSPNGSCGPSPRVVSSSLPLSS
jgi:ABC-type amino acid transport substrate-binding protein